MQTQIADLLNSIFKVIVNFLPALCKAILLLIVGFWIANRIDKLLKRYFDRRDYDISLEGFIRSLVNLGLKIIVIISVAGIIGLPSTSLVAVLGAAGLAVGLALQGSLSNFAGGVLILIFKPFRIGDLVTSLGETGVVTDIQIFNTILLTADNKTVILPNGAVSNGTIVNSSRHGNLRLEIKLSVEFDQDLNKVRGIILDVLKNDPQILKDPPPSVNIIEYGENTILLAVRPYASPEDYWNVYFHSHEAIRSAMIENNIKSVLNK